MFGMKSLIISAYSGKQNEFFMCKLVSKILITSEQGKTWELNWKLITIKRKVEDNSFNCVTCLAKFRYECKATNKTSFF